MSGYTAEMTELYTAEPETEPHIVIAKDKTVIVPEELRAIATQYEKNIETVTFDCPRYWDEHDLSEMRMYINFRRADGVELPHLCGVPTVDEADENIVHFDWTVGNDATAIKGKLSFVAVAKKADENGVLENRWGSRLCQDMEILEGIEPNYEEILEPSADIIEQLLTKLETATEAATDAAERAIAAAQSATVINKNLLDNWYFADPVNQRGKTEYTDNGYSVDRWYQEGRLVCNDGFVTHTPIQWYEGIRQNIEPAVISAIVGREVTLSVLVRSALANDDVRIAIYDMTTGALESTHAWMTVTNKWDVISATFTVPESYSGHTVAVLVSTSTGHASSGGSTDIIAIKLELGKKQTLAHQDADGNWVINEIPDKGMELLKCCMSTADPTDDYANNKKTPAAVGAVNKDGDTVRGTLSFASSSDPNGWTSIMKNHDSAYDAGSNISDYDKNAKNVTLCLKANQNKIAFYDRDSIEHDILHTGNKPSGSYTGNGEATARTIETGGIGNCCVVYGGTDHVAYLTPKGAFFQSGGTMAFTSDVSFSNGVITLRNAYIINTANIAYSYQVL